MRFRHKIQAVERGPQGHRYTTHQIRYWWPARRGQPRQSKVDPRTFRDKRDAERRALQILDQLELHAADPGRHPYPFAEQEPEDLATYLERFRQAHATGTLAVRKKRRPKPEHTQRLCKQLEVMFETFEMQTTSDLQAFQEGAAISIDELQTERATAASGKLRAFGDKPRDGYVTTLAMFCRYLVKLGAMSTNPVDDVPLLSGVHSVTFRRRALELDEFNKVLGIAS